MGRFRWGRRWLPAVVLIFVFFGPLGLNLDHHARSAAATSPGNHIWEMAGGVWVAWDLVDVKAGSPVELIEGGRRGYRLQPMLVSVAHWMEWEMWGGVDASSQVQTSDVKGRGSGSEDGPGIFTAKIRSNGDLLVSAGSTVGIDPIQLDSSAERREVNIPAGGSRKALLHRAFDWTAYRNPLVLVGAKNVQGWVEEQGVVRFDRVF